MLLTLCSKNIVRISYLYNQDIFATNNAKLITCMNEEWLYFWMNIQPAFV